jgi:hypothetical protein
MYVNDGYLLCFYSVRITLLSRVSCNARVGEPVIDVAVVEVVADLCVSKGKRFRTDAIGWKFERS